MEPDTIDVAPAWGHVEVYLTSLITALRAHPSLADITDPTQMVFRNNAWYMWDFCKRTQAKLHKIPVDLPSESETEWQKVVDDCLEIDGMINDVEGKLNQITDTYPHSFEFEKNEKELSRNLAQGLLEMDDDALGGLYKA